VLCLSGESTDSERLDIAFTGFAVFRQRAKDSKGCFPVNCPQLGNSAISFGAVANASGRDFIWRYCEDDAVIPDPKPKITLPLPSERLDIAFTGFAVFRQRVEDSKGCFPVNCPQLAS
jgi:hypothetical protein